MAIYRLITNGSFGPDEIKVMTAAYEAALIDLAVTNRDDPVTELIARAIVNITATGERDPTLTKERALNALGVRRPAAKPSVRVRYWHLADIPELPMNVCFRGVKQTSR